MVRADDITIAIQIRRDKSKAADEAVELAGRSMSLSLFVVTLQPNDLIQASVTS
jgi:hypothetical protein